MKPFRTAFLFLLLIPFASHSAEIVLKGNYYGFNLYVLNPSTANGFCVTGVSVNNVATRDEIRSNSFEIDFSQLNLKTGDAVTVVIRHSDGCQPTVINPKALQKAESFGFNFVKADKSGNLIWGTRGELSEDPFIIEQFRWNKWIQIGEVSVSDSAGKGQYSFDTNPHSGLNMFRILRNDQNGNPLYSKTIKYTSKLPEISLESSRVSDSLVFSAETLYEIFDLKGQFLAGGFAAKVDVSDLEKGKYWLNFDNKSVNFTRK